MREIGEQKFTGERSLFQSNGLKISNSNFFDGESPLKESNNIYLENTTFGWKYPLWYCKNIEGKNIVLFDDARSGIWYTSNIKLEDSTINAPKSFRRASEIKLINTTLLNAEETMWTCKDIILENVTVKGDYFAKDSEKIVATNMELTGNYAFDGARDIEITDSKIISKDAFWNAENITIKNSTIIGEYIAWNAKNVTLENCYIQSEQGFCYVEDLVIRNSKILNTDLAFEYSTVNIESLTKIDSIKNPISGKIKAKTIDKIIFDDTNIDKNATTIKEEK